MSHCTTTLASTTAAVIVAPDPRESALRYWKRWAFPAAHAGVGDVALSPRDSQPAHCNHGGFFLWGASVLLGALL